MTAVGPPDWPITALPERRSGTERYSLVAKAGRMPNHSCAGNLSPAVPSRDAAETNAFGSMGECDA
jgi:hypothetical protein